MGKKRNKDKWKSFNNLRFADNVEIIEDEEEKPNKMIEELDEEGREAGSKINIKINQKLNMLSN